MFSRLGRISLCLPGILAIAMAGCATQPHPEGAALPGFWYGLLHGFLMLFSLIGSLFWHVRIYAFPNAGRWYDFGFVVGAMLFWGGSHASRFRQTRRSSAKG